MNISRALRVPKGQTRGRFLTVQANLNPTSHKDSTMDKISSTIWSSLIGTVQTVFEINFL